MIRTSSSFGRKGFTLIEMLVSIAIFSVIIISFIGILVVVLQLQAQSSSSVAVNQESQYLLQKVQYYVESASVIIPTSTPNMLEFYVASSSADPSFIELSSGTVYLQQTASGPLFALTSPKVVVSNLTFTRNTNPPGHDVVSVSFTMRYNTTNMAQTFSQLFQSSIEHVSAATFDTNVLPAASGEPLGNSTYLWNPINGVINFSGSNVGIGVATPAEQLSVGSAVQLVSQSTAPSCNSTIRGTLWFYSPGGSSKDSLQLCAASATGTVVWQTIY